MEFLGFIFDSIKYTITVTPAKRIAMQKLVFDFWKIIGKIVSIFPACEEAKLHYQTFE